MPQIYLTNARIVQRLAVPQQGCCLFAQSGAYAAPGPRPVLEPPSSRLPGPALRYR